MYLELVALALLAEKPRYGYELKKQIELSYDYVAEINTNTIYPILRKFEKNDWTVKTVEPIEGKPNRHVYTITAAGRKELVSSLRNFPDSIYKKPEETMIRLVYFDWMDPASRKRLLDGREKVILEFQDSLDENLDEWVHPLIIEYGRNTRAQELLLIEKLRNHINSPCRMNENGEII